MKEDLQEHIDYLVDIMETIPMEGKITILTGSNGSGKSLLRKQLVFHVQNQIDSEGKSCVASTSMERRTSTQPQFGAMSGAMLDTAWMPTSNQTLRQIDAVLKLEDKYIVVDEPEIGMGEETIMALAEYLNDKFENLHESVHGVLIITHNRYLVEHLKCDHFINTDGIETKEDWLNRKLIPTSIEELRDNKLFYAVRDRQNSVKEKENEGKDSA